MTDGWTMEQVAALVAADLSEGAVVNLGIGLPTLVSGHLPAGREVILHSENGLLGMGGVAPDEDIDWDLIDAGKRPVTLVPGAAVMDQAASFALIRGGHLDVAVLGAYQVSRGGDLANWSGSEPGLPPAVGGAMDLAAGAREVYVIMKHVHRDGRLKLVERCTLPLTARGVVRRIYTNYCVLDVESGGLLVRALAPGVNSEALQSVTGTALRWDSRATSAAQGARS